MESLAICTTASFFSRPFRLSNHASAKHRVPSLGFDRAVKVCCASETMSASQGDRVAEKGKEAKLWGGRFEESVTDAVERFTESISYDKQLYKQDIMGSRAHASMLAKQVFTPSLCVLVCLVPEKTSRR
jgi:argininosuccinate lyase